jgi:uncharacterized protein YbaP (TraB family)
MRLIVSTLIAAQLTLWSAVAMQAASVWRISAPGGGQLYLGGSMHALRSTDYPLPFAYNRAFDASSRLVFEDDPKESAASFKEILKAGQYPKGDNLKNHIDPRTYDYLRRFFSLGNVSEDKFNKLRPWFIDMVLEMPPPQLYALGVESFLTSRAVANNKPISGLESRREHNEVFTGLNDHQSETLLLLTFINAGRAQSDAGDSMIEAWRRGDADTLARQLKEGYREVPSFAERLITSRNRNWLPKIEGYVRSGRTYFVVVGAGHMGGADGLLALLGSRGYQIEQL